MVFFDETSLSVWSHLRKRTFTDGKSVVFPYQAKRGKNQTIYGAVCGFMDLPEIDTNFRFVYTVTDRTSSVNTKAFFEKLLSELPVEISQMVVVLDNHSAHRSYLITRWAQSIGLQLFFLPAYSSKLNPGKPSLCICVNLLIR